MCPTMMELESLKWTESNGKSKEINILDECIANSLAEELQKTFGIHEDKISLAVRRIPMSFCRSVFQRWYSEGSSPKEAYPISWNGLIKALKAVGMNDLAMNIESALSQ